MWAVSQFTPRPLFFSPLPIKPRKPPFLLAVSATSQPHRRRSTPGPKNQQGQPPQGQEQEDSREQREAEATNQQQLKALDVLWAMQRAAAEKKKRSSGGAIRKTKKKEPSSDDRSQSKKVDDVDYSNLKPLRIKSDWKVRLDSLEKRLEELSASK
ncbi:hypothetical protein Tsubulata_010346 [Turnera subulata]|uniref:Uncharacterized protein n=1 Tax=Turnera subulata TaxID=218843 RepID=A0A9Q0J0X9_9ROSI|nr:hypothetical protein Tsubulata_010346 [Turnera subulata]